MCHFRGRAVSNGPDFTSGLDVEECAISGLCMGRTVTSRRRNLPISNFTEILPDAHLRWVLKHDGLQGCSAFLHTLSGATSSFAPALRTMALGRVPGGYRFNYVSSGRCLLRSVIVPTIVHTVVIEVPRLHHPVHRTLSAILPASGVCGLGWARWSREICGTISMDHSASGQSPQTMIPSLNKICEPRKAL